MLCLIEDWCNIWKIKLNASKTQLVLFGKRNSAQQNLHLNGTQVFTQPHMKILGVTFDRGVSMLTHCKEKAAIAHNRTGLLRLVAGRDWGANAQTLIRLYKTYIRPVLDYGYVTTHNASNAAISVLETAERKALRFATRTSKVTSNRLLYETALTFGIERLSDRLTDLNDTAQAKFLTLPNRIPLNKPTLIQCCVPDSYLRLGSFRSVIPQTIEL